MSRIFPLSAALLSLCLALASCSKVPGQASGTRNRGAPCPGCNVVLISMDTVRADHLSLYGYKRKTSPNLDRFAKKAFVFESAISQTAWTLPGHGAMMTGLYPSRLGVQRYPALRRLPEVETLASVFKKAGYETAGFTGGGFVAAHFGFDRGFDVYSSKGRRFDHNMNDALAWLERHRDGPFFLFVHGYDAHRPYYSNPSDRRAVGIDDSGPREIRGFCSRTQRRRPDNLELIVGYYDAAIHHADRFVGRLFDALKRLGLDRRTVVLVTSDHGEEFFEHGHCDHVRFLYQEVIRVPYILRIPGAGRPRRIAGVVPASISVARTLLDAVGVANNMPGVSLLPVVLGKRGPFEGVFSETESPLGALGSRGATIALTTATDKLIEYTEEGSSEGYDLRRDPGEQQVLPEGHPVYRKRASLRSWHDSLAPLPRAKRVPKAAARRHGARGKQGSREAEPKPEKIPKKLEDALRSLGYLE